MCSLICSWKYVPSGGRGICPFPRTSAGLCAPKLKPCHRLLPVNDALVAQGLVASDVITLACFPNGLLASSSGDSTSSSGIRTTPMPSAGVLRPDSCRGPLWRILTCTELTNPTFSATKRAQWLTLSGSWPRLAMSWKTRSAEGGCHARR